MFNNKLRRLIRSNAFELPYYRIACCFCYQNILSCKTNLGEMGLIQSWVIHYRGVTRSNRCITELADISWMPTTNNGHTTTSWLYIWPSVHLSFFFFLTIWEFFYICHWVFILIFYILVRWSQCNVVTSNVPIKKDLYNCRPSFHIGIILGQQ